MKPKSNTPSVVQELCRKLKIQLDQLSVELDRGLPLEEQARRANLLERLKRQLAELSG